MGILKRTKKTEEETQKNEAPVKDTKKKVSEKKATREVKGDAYKILEHTLVSEKTNRYEADGKYTFLVSSEANKVEVKKAIKALYGITPKSVNMINVEGKKKRFGRALGKRKDYKKAIVTVNKGDKLNVHVGL
ncbi:MAG: 50S ribosomal protein L23 [Candidatus Magasanikbacteria bacterium]